MSCVREASPPLQDTDHLRHDIKKRRLLQPLRGLRRLFRRKGRPVISTSDGSVDAVAATLRSSKENFKSCEQAVEATNLEPAKSHSTSHLTDDTTDNSQRRSLQSTLLSVSHDSVFTSEQRSPDSGSETSLYAPSRLGFPHSSVRAELFEAVKRRRALENNASDDEDLGLPRSPVSNSPTTADDMFTKEHIVTKSSQSTCSDGSLLSMGSSEIDEESYCHSSRHSSKLSLYEKRISSGSDLFSNNDKSSANTSSTSNNGTSLSHSAAKHKMAVKPKRNHGAPHKKRQIITSNTLPTTPEVNEENSHKNLPIEDKPVADSGQSDEHHESNQNYVNKTQQTRTTTNVEHHTSVTQINTCSGTESKNSSLPSDVSLSPVPSFKLLTRSKSNVVSPPPVQDDVGDETVTSGEKDLKKDDSGSFFSRLLLRRSSKKKKNAVDESDSNQKVELEVQSWKVTSSEFKEESSPVVPYMNGLNNAMKHHPLFRQRVEPLNLSNDSMAGRMHTSMVPVNMNDEMKTPVKKSHSFRNHEKLPYSCYEDTPSLPVNIGLVEDETVTERFSKHFHINRTPEPFKYSYTSTPEMAKESESPPLETPEYESVGFHKWKISPTKLPDYSNISVVNGNKVNISVGEAVKEKPDVRVPVPAPRTSLMNKSPEPFENSKDEENRVEIQDNYVNVTVTELSSGQRSIVSIGSIEMNSEPSSPLVDSVFEPLNFEEMKEEPKPPTPLSDPVEPEIMAVVPENNTESEEPCSTEPEIEEPFVSEIPSEVPTTPKPIEEPQPIVEKNEKPTHVVVTDFANGIVKVNDTTVVMRRKTKDVTQTKDEEPELMKVFARRSLKLKETDNLDELIDSVTKSRDSDKENEDFNSPIEERKKPEIKLEPPKNSFNKFQRSISHDVETNKNVSVLAPNGNEKRQRCKSIPNEMDVSPVKQPPLVSDGEKKSDKIEIENENVEEKIEKVEKIVTPFKRIQQRREEWEKRAQQATKVRGNN